MQCAPMTPVLQTILKEEHSGSFSPYHTVYKESSDREGGGVTVLKDSAVCII